MKGGQTKGSKVYKVKKTISKNEQNSNVRLPLFRAYVFSPGGRRTVVLNHRIQGTIIKSVKVKGKSRTGIFTTTSFNITPHKKEPSLRLHMLENDPVTLRSFNQDFL